MNDYDKIRAAFDIFDKYDHKKIVQSDHDLLYAGPEPADVSAEDTEALKKLGWLPSDDAESFAIFV